MPTKSKSTKRRTTVKDLPRKQKALDKAAQKKVKGGGSINGIFVGSGDIDSVIKDPVAAGGPHIRGK